MAGHLPPETNETTRKLQRLSLQLEHILERRQTVWAKLSVDEQNTQNCRVMVPGRVYPGVEISIGRAFMMVERIYENSQFRLCYNDIIVEPMPERKKAARAL